jgi:hypothetical protein
MTLQLELGQVRDDYARRALEQISMQLPASGGGGSGGVTLGPPIVTSLPVNGPDGETVILRNADMDANGCAWQARRRSLNGGWDFIGGAPYRLRGTTYQNTAPNTWEIVSTAVMPRWTCPANGVYRFLFGARVQQAQVTPIEAYMGISIVPTAGPVENIRTNLGQSAAGTTFVHVSYEAQVSMTAGQVIAGSFNTQTTATNVSFSGPWIYVEPARFT